MSCKRDKDRDYRRTKEVLAGGSHADEDDAKKNWLGHRFGSGAANIDELLLEGASVEQLKRAGRGAVREHLDHLRKEHGLKLVQADGRYRFGS